MVTHYSHSVIITTLFQSIFSMYLLYLFLLLFVTHVAHQQSQSVCQINNELCTIYSLPYSFNIFRQKPIIWMKNLGILLGNITPIQNQGFRQSCAYSETLDWGERLRVAYKYNFCLQPQIDGPHERIV